MPLVCAFAVAQAVGSARGGEVQRAERFEGRTNRAVRLGYLLYLPPGYGAKDHRWPLVLFLHGAGEAGTISTR